MKQRTGAAGESRVGLHTLPNRHCPKPRIDCAAILGKLSERIESFGSLGEIGKIGAIGKIGIIGLLNVCGICLITNFA